MKTKQTTVDHLKPNPKNPRSITEEQKQMLARSLMEFGDLGGIVLNTRTGVLVGGHQRVNEFRDNPDAKVTVTERLETPDSTGTIAWGYVEVGNTKFSYREVDWDEVKETAANLAANKMGGEFVYDQVTSLLQEIDGKIDLSLTGFSNSEILSLLEGLNKPLDIEEMTVPSDRTNFLISCANMGEMRELQELLDFDGTRTDWPIFKEKLEAFKNKEVANEPQ